MTDVSLPMEAARLRIQPTWPQHQFLTMPHKFKLFSGGIGSGKTFAGCLDLLRLPAGTTAMVVAPTYVMLRDSTLDCFMSNFRDFLAIDGWSESKYEMELVNGTKILWRTADKPDRLRGPSLGHIWPDEGALLPESVWDILIGRLRRSPGTGSVTTTPKGEMHWLYRVFVERHDPDYGYVVCSTRSNHHLPPWYVGALDRKYSGQFHAQEVEGKFVDFTEEPAYDGFNELVNVREGVFDQFYNPGLPLCVGIDINVGFMGWAVGHVVENRPVILTEIVMDGRADVRAMTRQLKVLFAGHGGGLWIYGDASGYGARAQTGQADYDLISDELANFSSEVVWMVPRKNPAPRDRIQSVNEVLRGSASRKPALIDADCKYLIRDFKGVGWNPQGTNVLKVTDREREEYTMTHASDGVGYWWYSEWPTMVQAALSEALRDGGNPMTASQAAASSRTPVRRMRGL